MEEEEQRQITNIKDFSQYINDIAKEELSKILV